MNTVISRKSSFSTINDLIEIGRCNIFEMGNVDDCIGMAESSYDLVKLIGRSRSRDSTYGNIDDVLHLGLPQGALCIISLGRGSLECFNNIDKYVKEGMTVAYAYSLQHHLNSRMEYDFSTVFYRYEVNSTRPADSLMFGTSIAGRANGVAVIKALEELVLTRDTTLSVEHSVNTANRECPNTLVFESRKC